MKISEIFISYMGRDCSIEDCVKYGNNLNGCNDLSKVSAIVYISKELDNIELEKDELHPDTIMDWLSFHQDKGNFLFLKIIQLLELEEVPDYSTLLLNTNDIDEKWDLILQFARTLNLE